MSRYILKYPFPYEVLDTSLKKYLNHKRREGFALLGLGKGASSLLASNYSFCDRSVSILIPSQSYYGLGNVKVEPLHEK